MFCFGVRNNHVADSSNVTESTCSIEDRALSVPKSSANCCLFSIQAAESVHPENRRITTFARRIAIKSFIVLGKFNKIMSLRGSTVTAKWRRIYNASEVYVKQIFAPITNILENV